MAQYNLIPIPEINNCFIGGRIRDDEEFNDVFRSVHQRSQVVYFTAAQDSELFDIDWCTYRNAPIVRKGTNMEDLFYYVQSPTISGEALTMRDVLRALGVIHGRIDIDWVEEDDMDVHIDNFLDTPVKDIAVHQLDIYHPSLLNENDA